MNAPLISVIVPIYNVEKYVRKCLESFVNQTLKQIEVICIDDGSTDSSGAIADEYCNTDAEGNGKEWPVIRIIHTENRGLSAARNRGIDEARSEWLMFVDSDDWVDREFCRIPYEAAVRENADLVIFRSYRVSKTGNRVKRGGEIPSGKISFEEAVQYGDTVAWNKLYRKVLFEGIRYPTGRVHEEIAATHKIVHKAETIISLENILYNYLDRNGSITHIHTIANKRDRLVAGIERQEDLISYGYSPEIVNLCRDAIGYLSVTEPCDDPLFQKAVDIVDSVKGYPKGLTMKQRIGLTVWRINRSLFYLMCKGIGRA